MQQLTLQFSFIQHQASDKLVENLQKRLDNLPPGELRDKEEERAEKELENIKKVQGLVQEEPQEHPDPRGVDTPSEEPAPPQGDGEAPPPPVEPET